VLVKQDTRGARVGGERAGHGAGCARNLRSDVLRNLCFYLLLFRLIQSSTHT
jgi:hypothetical protein